MTLKACTDSLIDSTVSACTLTSLTKRSENIHNNHSHYSSLSMDLNGWCNSGNQNMCCCQSYVKRGYDRALSFNGLITGSKTPRWRLLWRKIKRDKKRIFDCSSGGTDVHVPYDPYTYSQNFDQGYVWADPDNASRSFSARFAVPSRVFQKSELVA